MEFSRREVTFTRRDVIWSLPRPRRDVTPHVATSFGHVLCHVATWDFNVATWACLLSVTSRREPARRDVALFLAQKWFIFHLHRTPLFLLNPSSLAHRPCPTLPELRSCSPTTVSHPLCPVLGHSGFSTTVCPILAWVQ